MDHFIMKIRNRLCPRGRTNWLDKMRAVELNPWTSGRLTNPKVRAKMSMQHNSVVHLIDPTRKNKQESLSKLRPSVSWAFVNWTTWANNRFPRSIMTDWRRQTRRQAFFFIVIGWSSARIKESLPDGDVIVVEVIKELLLAWGLLGVFDISLCDEVVVGLTTCGGVILGQGARVLNGSTQGIYPRQKGSWRCRTKKQQNEKRDVDDKDEVNWRDHSPCAWNIRMTMEWTKTQKLELQCECI